MEKEEWCSISVNFKKEMWGRKTELYHMVVDARDFAKAESFSYQIYGGSRADRAFHISLRFLDLKNREDLLKHLREQGFNDINIFDYPESKFWLDAATFASNFAFDLMNDGADNMTPDREFLVYLIHAMMNNLFLSYEDELDVFSRLHKWAMKRVEEMQR